MLASCERIEIALRKGQKADFNMFYNVLFREREQYITNDKCSLRDTDITMIIMQFSVT